MTSDSISPLSSAVTFLSSRTPLFSLCNSYVCLLYLVQAQISSALMLQGNFLQQLGLEEDPLYSKCIVFV